MPRDSGSGVYTPPANTSAIPGQPIESAKFNSLVSDIVAAFNSAWPVGLGGTGRSSLTTLLSDIGGVAKSGDTMSGTLTLSGNATGALHAVPKQQVDAGLATKADASHAHTASQITDFNAAVTARLGATGIDALSDVAITSPSPGQALIWNGTNFVNQTYGPAEYDKGVLAANTTYTQAHGLGALPSAFDIWLECTTADQGYSVGERLSIIGVMDYVNGMNVSMTATQCFLMIRSVNSFTALNKTTRSDVFLTPARWNVIFRIFK